MCRDYEELKRYIREFLSSRAPGILEVLDIVAKNRYNSSILDLLFTKPREFMEVIREYYGDQETVTFVLSVLFIKPVASRLGILDKVEEMVYAFMYDPDSFVRILGCTHHERYGEKVKTLK